MNPFFYYRPNSIDEAIHLAQDPTAMFIGGGTNLLDLMKGNIAAPKKLIDGRRVRDLPITCDKVLV